MGQILDESGRPVPTRDETPETCPKCGAGAKNLQHFSMFGGHEKIICKKCGETVKHWRE